MYSAIINKLYSLSKNAKKKMLPSNHINFIRVFNPVNPNQLKQNRTEIEKMVWI